MTDGLYAEALAATGRLLTSTLDPVTVGQEIVTSVSALLSASSVALYLLDGVSEDLALHATSRPAAELAFPAVMKAGMGVSDLVMREGAPAIVSDPLADPRIRYPQEVRDRIARTPARALLSVPLMARGHAVGVLHVADVVGRRFEPREVKIVDAFAQQAALALENARMFAREVARREQSERLAEVARNLLTDLNSERMLHLVVEATSRAFSANVAIFFVEDNDLLVERVSSTRGTLPAGGRMAFDQGITGVCAARRSGVVVNDYPAWAQALSRYVSLGLHRAMAQPLLVGEHCLGVITLSRTGASAAPFSDEDLAVLGQFAGHAALALENARVYEEVDRRRREAEVLTEVAQTINASLDVDAILQRVAEGARALCQSDMARIAVRDAESGALSRRFQTNARYDGYGSARLEAGTQSLGGLVLLTGAPVRTDDWMADPRFSKETASFVEAEGIVAQMAVPIRILNEIEGLLYVDNRAPRPFTDSDEAALTRLAEHAAVAIRNAQLFAERRRSETALRESEKRYRLLAENAADVISVFDDELRLTYVSPSVMQLRGYTVEEAMRQTMEERLTPDALELVAQALAEDMVIEVSGAGNPSRSVTLELELPHKGGGTVWTETTITSLRDDLGRREGFLSVSRNITERRKAEHAAAALADMSHALARSIDPDTVDRLAAESVCRLLSAQSAALFRLEPESGALVRVMVSGVAAQTHLWLSRMEADHPGIAGLAVRERRPIASPDLLHDPRMNYTEEQRETVGRNADRAGLAIPLFAPERTLGVLVLNGHTGRAFTDHEIALAGAFADHAALALYKAHLVADLRASRDFLASIAQNSLDAIITTDVSGRITYFSPGAERLLGYRANEIVGRAAEVLYASGSDEVLALRQRLESEEHVADYETVFLTKDGQPRDVGASISVLRDAGGARTGAIGLVRDVTQRKRMEASLRQSEKLAAMGALLAGVAHELNNPLAIIAGYTEILKQSALDKRTLQRVHKVGEAVDRCARIVRNFLALARQAPPERDRVDLNTVVREAMEMVTYQLKVDGVQVRLDLASDLPALWADGHQLHQLVVNLVTNAHHALREGTAARKLTLTSRLDAATNAVRLVVADNGPGIPADIQARIFEPFFTTKAVGKGTGLGLSLCRNIAIDHEGTLELASEPTHGAAFTLTLPVTTPAVTPLPAASPLAPAPLSRASILVVDDEPGVAELLVEIITQSGHHADTVGNGLLALERLAEHAYDAVVSDLRMPGLDGQGLFREVERRHPQLASRFVFLTGDALGDETRAFLEETGAPLLDKPFTLEDVEGVLHRLLAAVRSP